MLYSNAVKGSGCSDFNYAAFCHFALCTLIRKYLSTKIHSVTTQSTIIFFTPFCRISYISNFITDPMIKNISWNTDTALRLSTNIHSLVFSPRGRSGRNQSPVMEPMWLLAHCILVKFLGIVCHCFSPPLDVPSFATTCLCVLSDARDPSSELRARKMSGSNFA